MDTSHLARQVTTSISQLHGLFDEIGIPDHDREAREEELFEALSKALNDQVRLVNAEKKEMVDEAKKIITQIHQMEASIEESRSRQSYDEDDQLEITYPLTHCLRRLKEKHAQVARRHRERFEQVRKLAEALVSYSSHLEDSFVQMPLPPTDPKQSVPPNFDLSAAYVHKLDNEFTRVYEEYARRISAVQSLSDQIIQLWAELGTPQAQQDNLVVKFSRESPEQLGLHKEDLDRLKERRDRLAEEKQNREKLLRDLRANVEALWEKLGVDEAETKAFLNTNRGCGVRQINEFEDELSRLNELKRQNLHLFVEDARVKLQGLWDALYFSEDEMLDFTPAFSDVYSDALLEAHEREIARLEALQKERAPLLALIDRHRTLVQERDELQASSQDASRLMMRGQKGEKRDPGKLLREEKMRKRIAKELPKVTVDVRKALETWEDEWGRPFLVHGERYIEELEETTAEVKRNTSVRSKTPAGPPPSASRGPSKMPSNNTLKSSVPPRSTTKTPTSTYFPTLTKQPPNFGGSLRASPTRSPTRLPGRAPLTNLKHGNNSPERPRLEQRAESFRPGPPLMRVPPPKMRDLVRPDLETPMDGYRTINLGSSIVRQIEPEDVYDDGPRKVRSHSTLSHSTQSSYSEELRDERYATVRASHQSYRNALQNAFIPPPPARQLSNASSHSTVASGSENWETYDDISEPELDVSDTYYAKVRAARVKDGGEQRLSGKPRIRGTPPYEDSVVMIDEDGNRVTSGSEWAEEGVY